jgi:hypothetical protein
MRIQVAVPEAHVSADVLNAALEPVTRLDEQMIREGRVPPFDRALHYGVKWKPEPPGGERFDHAGIVMQRRHGDCDDLAPYHAASLRTSGEDPGARAVVRRSGPNTWHAVVQRSDGTVDDPSKRAGMPSRGDRLAGAPTCPPMCATNCQVKHTIGGHSIGAYLVRPSIAVRPIFDKGFQARVDIPWFHDKKGEPTPTDIAMATLHANPVAHTALTGAIEGACRLGVLGGYAHKNHIDRLCCIADAVEGASYSQLARVYGPEHAHAAQQYVSGFFDDLGKIVKNVVAPIASKVVQFIPGVGPIASTAIDVAAKFIPDPGKSFGVSNVLQAAGAAAGKLGVAVDVGPAVSNALNIARGLAPTLSTAIHAATRPGTPAPAPRPAPAPAPRPAPAPAPKPVPLTMPGHPFGGFQPPRGATRLCIPVEFG